MFKLMEENKISKKSFQEYDSSFRSPIIILQTLFFMVHGGQHPHFNI